MLKFLSTPTANDHSPRYMEKALAALHQGMLKDERVSLEIGVSKGRIGFFVRGAAELEPLVLGPLVASYPLANLSDIEPADDPALVHPQEWQCRSCALVLEPQLFPILRHAQFEDMLQRAIADPIDTVLRSVLPTAHGHGHIRLEIRPVSHRLHRRARRTVELLERSFFRHRPRLGEWFAGHCLESRWLWLTWPLALRARCSPVLSQSLSLDVSVGARHEREADLQAAADKVGGHLFHAQLTLTAWGVSDEATHRRLRVMASAFGAFTRSRLAMFHVVRQARPFLLSQEELATLWHPPMAGAGIEQLDVASFQELEPPPSLPSGVELGAVTLGRVRFRQDTRTVGLAVADRRRHVHLIGRTGTGKTTLLLNMIASDLINGHSLALIDPHGDLAEAVLSLVPVQRTELLGEFRTVELLKWNC